MSIEGARPIALCLLTWTSPPATTGASSGLAGSVSNRRLEEVTQSMNVLLWCLQILLAVYFGFIGVMHFAVPPGLPAPMVWMYELSPGLHIVSGTDEILAVLGLTLPALTRIQPRLTPLAALGLVLVMAGAVVWHLGRGETVSILMNVVLAVLAGFVAYGRWRLKPISPRQAA